MIHLRFGLNNDRKCLLSGMADAPSKVGQHRLDCAGVRLRMAFGFLINCTGPLPFQNFCLSLRRHVTVAAKRGQHLIVTEVFNSIPSMPPNHFDTALGQVERAFSGNCAG